MKVGGDNRGWDDWMAPPAQWWWVWASSGRWWRTGKPGVLQPMGSQTLGHKWVTEQQNIVLMFLGICQPYSYLSPSFHLGQLFSHLYKCLLTWTFLREYTMDCSPPISSVHEILQARILEWVASPFSRSFQPRDSTQVSYTAGRFFTIWVIREAYLVRKLM